MNKESTAPSNYIVTAPDILDNDLECLLLVNASDSDITALHTYLPWARGLYNIYLYNTGDDRDWAYQVAKKSTKILASRELTNLQTLDIFLDMLSNIVWFGKNQPFISPTEFLAKHDQNKSKR